LEGGFELLAVGDVDGHAQQVRWPPLLFGSDNSSAEHPPIRAVRMAHALRALEGARVSPEMLLQGRGGVRAVVRMDQPPQFRQRDLMLPTAEQVFPSGDEVNRERAQVALPDRNLSVLGRLP